MLQFSRIISLLLALTFRLTLSHPTGLAIDQYRPPASEVLAFLETVNHPVNWTRIRDNVRVADVSLDIWTFAVNELYRKDLQRRDGRTESSLGAVDIVEESIAKRASPFSRCHGSGSWAFAKDLTQNIADFCRQMFNPIRNSKLLKSHDYSN